MLINLFGGGNFTCLNSPDVGFVGSLFAGNGVKTDFLFSPSPLQNFPTLTFFTLLLPLSEEEGTLMELSESSEVCKTERK